MLRIHRNPPEGDYGIVKFPKPSTETLKKNTLGGDGVALAIHHLPPGHLVELVDHEAPFKVHFRVLVDELGVRV